MSFLNNNLNKPKLNGIKKPAIKMPKLEPKTEVKLEVPKTEEVKETNEIEFNPTPVEEPKVEEENSEPVKEEVIVEEKEETVEEQQQTFDDFKTLEEAEEPATVEETAEEKIEETPAEVPTEEESVEEGTKEEVKEEPVPEEKPKKKRTRKKAVKKEDPVVDEENTSEESGLLSPTMIGSNDLEFMDEYLAEIVNPTNQAWEEEKVIVNQRMDEIVIDTDMGSLEMDEMLSKLSHLENDVRQRLDEIGPVYFNVQDLINFVESNGKGTNATERKANGKLACTRYVKEPGAEPINLYTYFNFHRARYEFYKSKMEQIKNENGRLITLSAVKKLEVSLSR